MKYGETVRFVSIWSTDAFFRETLDKIREYRKEGVSTIDMESTAVLAISKYYGVDVAILLIISDEIYDKTWKTGWGGEKLVNREKKALSIILDFIHEMVGSDINK